MTYKFLLANLGHPIQAPLYMPTAFEDQTSDLQAGYGLVMASMASSSREANAFLVNYALEDPFQLAKCDRQTEHHFHFVTKSLFH